jgi:murein DD-endopeptidase MepM/ murein hydrolase activator NlpD
MYSSRASKVILVGLIFLLLASACNYPGMKPGQTQLPVQELRQTLAAQTGATAELQTAKPQSQSTPQPINTLTGNSSNYRYLAQSGDTLPALAGRFDVETQEITSAAQIPTKAFIPIGQELIIPKRVTNVLYPIAVLPDSEVINSPTTLDFDINRTISQAGGYLNHYTEMVQAEQISGAEIVQRVALESSVNPRFLLALLELRSGWVRGLAGARSGEKYPIGFHVSGWEGLYKELVITATHLNAGYYGWREGRLAQLQFQGGRMEQTSPEMNAGSIAVQYLLAKLYPPDEWQTAIYGPRGLLVIYQEMFGDPWSRAAVLGPLFPEGISQPALELPFARGERWSLTGGPHPSWKTGSPPGALDLAPVTGEKQCAVSGSWVLASASGLVVRSERNVVAIDLDGDGHEETGWVIIYMHIADKERISTGRQVKTDDPLGHPSCEGGSSTGTHVHIARKYNGEWIAADGPLPFLMSGWEAFAGQKIYLGGLKKGNQQVVASPVGPRTSIIIR